MTKSDIMQALQEIFKEVLDNEEIQLAEQTVADDIEEWDSLSHIQLIVAIERHFGFKFRSAEARSFANVGEIATAVAQKSS
ncbi:MAG: acyl carrier protein [Bacteroidota bacterium]